MILRNVSAHLLRSTVRRAAPSNPGIQLRSFTLSAASRWVAMQHPATIALLSSSFTSASSLLNASNNRNSNQQNRSPHWDKPSSNQPARSAPNFTSNPATRNPRPSYPAQPSSPIAPTDANAESLSNQEAREAFDGPPFRPAQPSDPILPTEANAESLPNQESSFESGTDPLRPPSPGPSSSGGGTGSDGLPKSAYISSADRKRDRLAAIFFGTILLGIVGGTVYMGRNWESELEARAHPDAPNGWGLGLFYNRVRARTVSLMDFYNEPAFEKLLPDPIPDPNYQRPYTLVLSLEDLLVHSEWTREYGWRTAKRPGLDYFLGYLSQYYEIVIFTSQPAATAMGIVQKLDPYRSMISAQLFREATRYQKGKYIKDLSFMNRDLSTVILLDTNPAAYSLQPENAIPMRKWKGDAKDKDLVAMIPFLEYIATVGVKDVRDVISTFPHEAGTIPPEFAKREALARQEFHKQREAEKKSSKRGGVTWLNKLLGLPSPSQHENLDKMPSDVMRERGQQAYEAHMKNLKENGERMLEEEKKREQEELAQMKTSISQLLTEGLPKPPSQKPSE